MHIEIWIHYKTQCCGENNQNHSFCKNSDLHWNISIIDCTDLVIYSLHVKFKVQINILLCITVYLNELPKTTVVLCIYYLLKDDLI